MTDVYEASVAALRRELLNRRNAVQESLSALANPHSGYAEDHRRLVRIYNSLIRKFEEEVYFEHELATRRTL